MKVTKIVQKHFLCPFSGFLVTIICDVKIDVIMCEPHYVNLFFLWTSSIVYVFDFLTFDIFLTIWHLFDNLTSFWHFDISFNLNHLSPSQGYFLCWRDTLHSFMSVYKFCSHFTFPILWWVLSILIKKKKSMCPDPTFRLRYCLCVQVNYMYLFTFFHLMCPALLCGLFVLFCGPFDVSWSYIFFSILCVPLFFVARSYYFMARSMCPDPTFKLTLRLRYCFVFWV